MRKPLSEMSPEEFDAYIEQKNIERQNQKSDESRPPLFYRTFKDIYGLERVEKTFEVYGKIVDSKLELHIPMPEPREGLLAHDNQIVINNTRLVIHLVDDEVDGPFSLF